MRGVFFEVSKMRGVSEECQSTFPRLVDFHSLVRLGSTRFELCRGQQSLKRASALYSLYHMKYVVAIRRFSGFTKMSPK